MEKMGERRGGAASRGFTLIELVLVVVVLGILAAVALPKYVDLSGEARQVAVNNVGVAIEEATMNNRMAYALGHPGAVPVNMNACSRAFLESMLHTPLPEAFGVVGGTGGGGSCATPGAASMGCRGVFFGKRVIFNVHCAGN